MAGNSRPGGIGPLDPIYDVETAYGSIATGNTPGTTIVAVTINKAVGQDDPTNQTPILFDVVFSEDVTGFTDSGVTLTGSAGAINPVVSAIDPANYQVSVTDGLGLTPGQVIARIPASVVMAVSDGGPNAPSTSTDNTVEWLGAFTPPSISGLAAWYDASNAGSITAIAGAVSQWNDLSGNGHDLLQTVAGSKPTTGTRTQNSLNVVDFSTDDVIETGSAFWYNLVTSSMFIVLKPDGAGSGTGGKAMPICERLSSATAEHYEIRTTGTTNLDAYCRDDTNTVQFDIAGSNIVDGNPHLVALTDSGTLATLYVDAVSPASQAYTRSATSFNTFALGGFVPESSYMDGWIAEVVIYDSVLSSGDRIQVHDYLVDKWGL